MNEYRSVCSLSTVRIDSESRSPLNSISVKMKVFTKINMHG